METTVSGVYRTPAAADQALSRLVAARIPRDSISLVLADTKEHERLTMAAADETEQGVFAGIVAGGLFASLLVGMLALPAIGFLAVGPITAALGAGGVGAAAGGIVGALVGHGLSTQTAQSYEDLLREGGILLVVHTDLAHVRTIMSVLATTGAEHVAESVHLRRTHHGGTLDAAGAGG